MTQTNVCKICESKDLRVMHHTATCGNCGTLLYYPYPADDATAAQTGEKIWHRRQVLSWYSRSSFFNHHNFTNMLRFAMGEEHKGRPLDILDFGGGGGQFALVCRSMFPEATVYITDISDEALLDEYCPMNRQIRHQDFPQDCTRFDVIFLNDVFEHVSDPAQVLRLLRSKLKSGGLIAIDTPKQFWIYPLSKFLAPPLYEKVLRGTVSRAHLQIWTAQSFRLVVAKADLRVSRYRELSEYTMPAEYYLKNMGITNPLLRLAASAFYANARYLARNKIMAVLN